VTDVASAEDWKLLAACRGQRPKVFLPDDSGDRNKTNAAHEAALVFCRRCAVVEECLTYAILNGCNWGVWGGTTPRQRRTIRERRQRVE
jgi:WhiB family transcriptional regulator, redox-sensing transcriptional regulator